MTFVHQVFSTKQSFWHQLLKILLVFLYQAIKLLLWCGCYVNRRSIQLLLVMLIGDLCNLKVAVSIGDLCKLKKFAVNQSPTRLELS